MEPRAPGEKRICPELALRAGVDSRLDTR